MPPRSPVVVVVSVGLVVVVVVVVVVSGGSGGSIVVVATGLVVCPVSGGVVGLRVVAGGWVATKKKGENFNFIS